MIRCHNIDCMKFMKSVPDGSYDLAIVDPPYGIGAPKMSDTPSKRKKNRLNSGSGKLDKRILNASNCDWDNEIPPPQYFHELFRVSKYQIIWGGNYFPLPPTRCMVCWDKCQPWENFSQFELAWTSFDRPAAMFRFDNRTGEKIHPTQKPVALYKWLMTKFAKPGWKLLDTHGGSFSSAIAAHELGFDMDICEIDETYFKAGKERLDKIQQQLFLPIEEATQGDLT